MRRNDSFTSEVARLKREVNGLKSNQFFGSDVTTPILNQRYNLDGTPTHHDIEGVYSNSSGFDMWEFTGDITFTAQNQSDVYATVYFLAYNSSSTTPGLTSFGSILSFNELDFSTDKTVSFYVSGNDSKIYNPSVDRIWVKVFVYATDYGSISINLTQGTVVTI